MLDLSWVSVGKELLTVNDSKIVVTRINKKENTFDGAILGKTGNRELLIVYKFNGINNHEIENFEFDIKDAKSCDAQVSEFLKIAV